MLFKLGELFCGPGGIGYAAKTAAVENINFKISHAWATDYDKDTCKTYESNIAEKSGTVVCEDIRRMNLLKLLDISAIDALAFGFPCNDFSIVGKQKGMDGVYGPLYSFGIKALKEFKPKWFFAENVGGLRNTNDGRALAVILDEMYEAGYSIYPHLYKFEEYGIPQSRHRIIIIGIREDIEVVYKVPATTSYSIKTCREAIENPPIKEDDPDHIFTNQSKTVVERLKYIKPGENAFNAVIPKNLQLNVKGTRISQIYKRLDPKKPSYTVTGSGGGGTHVYHWKENRALTNRERARLQTFPDDFRFTGSRESVRKQIGMAVPVEGARIIFEAVLRSFSNEYYESEDYNFSPRLKLSHTDLFNNLKKGELFSVNKKHKYAVL